MENGSPSKFTPENLASLSIFFKTHDFNSQVFKQETSYDLSSEENVFEFEKTKEYTLPALNDTSEDYKQKVINELNDLRKTSKFFEDFCLHSKIEIGDKFQPFSLPLVYGDDEQFLVSAPKNTNFMLFFWKSEYLPNF